MALVKRTVTAVEPIVKSPASGKLAAVVGTPATGDVPTWDGTKYAPASGGAFGAVSAVGSFAPRFDPMLLRHAAVREVLGIAGSSTTADDASLILAGQVFGA